MKKLFILYGSAFLSLVCAIVLCCVFMQNVVAKLACVILLGIANGVNLYNSLALIERIMLERKLTFLANAELARFKE